MVLWAELTLASGQVLALIETQVSENKEATLVEQICTRVTAEAEKERNRKETLIDANITKQKNTENTPQW